LTKHQAPVQHAVQPVLSTENICYNDNWPVCNKISLNFEKSNYMIFKPPSNLDVLENNLKLKLLINNRNISRVSSAKYLGVWIDEHLT